MAVLFPFLAGGMTMANCVQHSSNCTTLSKGSFCRTSVCNVSKSAIASKQHNNLNHQLLGQSTGKGKEEDQQSHEKTRERKQNTPYNKIVDQFVSKDIWISRSDVNNRDWSHNSTQAASAKHQQNIVIFHRSLSCG